MEEFLVANRPLIYFGYGLTFFLMGWTIWVQPHPESNLKLARSLPFLAAFGFLHGLGEWGYVFIPIQGQFLSDEWVQLLYAFHQLLFGASFLALFLFGCYLIADSDERLSWLPILPLIIFGYWFAHPFLYTVLTTEPHDHGWTVYTEAMGRYLLAFPGALTAAVGLYRQIKQFRETGFPRLVPDLRGASLAMGAYTFFSGLLVPYQAFFPANVLNRELLLQVGIPVPIPRMICSMVITYYLLRTLRVFNAEVRLRLETAEAARATAEERDRLGCDLHDGILQSIYAAGLGLQAARRLIRDDPDKATGRVDLTLTRLDRVIEEIRAYIRNLAASPTAPLCLRTAVAEAAAEFESVYGISVDCGFDGILPSDSPGHLSEQAMGIVREALSNIGRHAGANRVSIRVSQMKADLQISIQDDGRGFDLVEALARKGHYGLKILHRRAETTGGTVRIDSAPGRGTCIEAVLPLEPSLGKAASAIW